MVVHAFLSGEARVECLARPHASVDGMPETVVVGQPGKGLVRRSQCPHVRLLSRPRAVINLRINNIYFLIKINK
jgi:hypothetical protein